jgi:predicted extracellular nuclease
VLRTRILTAAAVALAGTFTVAVTAPAITASAFPNTTSTVFINELHYDNTGTDTGEFVEIAGPAGTDVTGWSVVPYNGNGGATYTPTAALSGTLTDQGGGYGTTSSLLVLQNGAPDGLALVDNVGAVVQFLSYEGAFVATNGPAIGLTSTDIGVSQAGTEPVGSSLHLVGSGSTYGDFTWAPTTAASPGAINTGQAFASALAVTVDPVSQTVATGSPATITATPTGGTEPYGFQWYEGAAPGTLIVGETNAALTVTPGAAGTTEYYVEVTDATPTTVASGTASVTAEAPVPPALDPITPSSYTVTEGDSVELTVTVASGTGPFTYEWFSGTPGAGVTTGVTTATFNSGPLAADTSFYVVVTGASGAASAATSNVVTVDVVPPPCANPIDLISEIQGTTETSPCLGVSVVTTGVVVGDFEGASPALRGFYIQSLDADQDDDPLTSEGLFVFNGANTDSVDLGDEVQVTGTVGENQGQTQVSISSLNPPIILATDQTVTPATPVLPVATADGLERFEGMSVTFNQELTVTELFQLGRFGQVTVSADGRLDQPTAVVEPGPAAIALQSENNLRKLIIDDASQAQNTDPIVWGRGGLPLSASNTLRGGDTTTGATGVLTYTWGGNSASPNAYRLRPASPAAEDIADITFDVANPRPTSPPEVGGSLTVSGFNVLNYFRTLDVGTAQVCGPIDPPGLLQECRGAETAAELTRQHDKLIAALLKIDADVFGFAELENSTGVDPLQPIIDSLNAVDGADTWASVDTDPATVGPDTIGTDTIRVGVIYRQDRVEQVGVPAVLDDSVDPTFDDENNRPTLAVSFSELATGEEMTVVVNHWKSKGCGGATGLNADQFDGASCWDPVRTAAATAVVNWLGDYPTGIVDDDVLIFGDLNSYAQENPIDVLRNAGYVDLVQAFNPGAYSYVFDGQWGTLDYAFGSSTLAAQVTGADDYHINADEPSILDYNTNFKSAGQILSLYSPDEFRTSDHDPAVVGVDLGGAEPTVTIDQSAGQADPTNGTSVEFTVVFSDAVTGFDAGDVVVTGTATTGTPVVSGSEPGTTFTVTIPVTGDGTVIVDIPAGAANIALGAPSLPSTSTDNMVTVDTARPSVTVTPPTTRGNQPGPAVYVIEFSEQVSGLLVSELLITGKITGYEPFLTTTDGITWMLIFMPNAPKSKFNAKQVTVSVPEGVAVDAAGNTNTASPEDAPGRPTAAIAV